MGGRKPRASRPAPAGKGGTKPKEKPFPLRRKLCRIGLCTLDPEQHLEVMEKLVRACPPLASVWNSERKRSQRQTGAARKKATAKPRKVKRPDLVNTLKADQSRVLFGMLFGKHLENLVEDMLRTRKWARKRKDNEVMAEVLTVYWRREKHPVTPEDVGRYFERVGNQSIQPTPEFLANVDSLYPFPPEIPGRKYQEEPVSPLHDACGSFGKMLTESDSDEEEEDEIEDPFEMEPEHLTQEDTVSQDGPKLLQLESHLDSKPVCGLDSLPALVKEDADQKPCASADGIIMKLEGYEWPGFNPWSRVKKSDPDAMCTEGFDAWAPKTEDDPCNSPIWHFPSSPKMEVLSSQDSLICSQPGGYSPVKCELSTKYDSITAVKHVEPQLETSVGGYDDFTSPQLVPLPEGRATTIEFVDDVILSPSDLQGA